MNFYDLIIHIVFVLSILSIVAIVIYEFISMVNKMRYVTTMKLSARKYDEVSGIKLYVYVHISNPSTFIVSRRRLPYYKIDDLKFRREPDKCTIYIYSKYNPITIHQDRSTKIEDVITYMLSQPQYWN